VVVEGSDWGETDSLNLYNYLANNPINNIDILGLTLLKGPGTADGKMIIGWDCVAQVTVEVVLRDTAGCGANCDEGVGTVDFTLGPGATESERDRLLEKLMRQALREAIDNADDINDMSECKLTGEREITPLECTPITLGPGNVVPPPIPIPPGLV